MRKTLKIGGFFQLTGQSRGKAKAPAANPNALSLEYRENRPLINDGKIANDNTKDGSIHFKRFSPPAKKHIESTHIYDANNAAI